jgi:hypothetical protein
MQAVPLSGHARLQARPCNGNLRVITVVGDFQDEATFLEPVFLFGSRVEHFGLHGVFQSG